MPIRPQPVVSRIRHLWIVMACCGCASTAIAGAVLESESRDLTASSTPAAIIKTFAQGDQLRVESSDARDGVMIFKNDALYHINHEDKTYRMLDRASMQRMAEQINPALKQLEEQLAQMPAEQRAQIEKMMGQQAGMTKPKPQDVRKTGRSGKVGSDACQYVELVEDGVVIAEACVAAPGTLRGGDELMSAARKLTALMQDMMSAVDAPWVKQMVNNQTANFDKLGGVPLLLRQFNKGAAVHEVRMKSLRSEALPANLFEPPANYARQDMTFGR